MTRFQNNREFSRYVDEPATGWSADWGTTCWEVVGATVFWGGKVSVPQPDSSTAMFISSSVRPEKISTTSIKTNNLVLIKN